jgi:cytidylate kinase
MKGNNMLKVGDVVWVTNQDYCYRIYKISQDDTHIFAIAIDTPDCKIDGHQNSFTLKYSVDDEYLKMLEEL